MTLALNLSPKYHFGVLHNEFNDVSRIDPHTLSNEHEREFEALMEGKGRSLGLMGDFKDHINWFGGRIQFSLKLRVDKVTKAVTFKCCPFTLGKSTEVTRRLGSLSVVQIKYDRRIFFEKDASASDIVKDVLCRPLVICGRIFVLWYLKGRENKACYIEVNKDYERKRNEKLGDHYRMTYEQFIEWMNPIMLNSKQALSKYLTRG